MTDHYLVVAFRELRHRWFQTHLKYYPSEHQWEEDQDIKYAEEQCRKLKEKYDEQTEAIISGDVAPISPLCAADMDKPH